jgi:hypothetical protein
MVMLFLIIQLLGNIVYCKGKCILEGEMLGILSHGYLKITGFWDVAACNLVVRYQCFRRTLPFPFCRLKK